MRRQFIDHHHSAIEPTSPLNFGAQEPVQRDELGFKEDSIFYSVLKAPAQQSNKQNSGLSIFTGSSSSATNTAYKSKNDIFALNHSISKPALKMDENELLLLKSPQFNALVNIPHARAAIDDDMIYIPITHRSPPHTPSMAMPTSVKTDKRLFQNLDENEVSSMVQTRTRKQSIDPPRHTLKPMNLFSPSSSSLDISAAPQRSIPSTYDAINLSFLPTRTNFLGEGRYSLVYKGHYSCIISSSKNTDSRNINTCAVKRLHADPEAQAMGLSELYILRRLSYTNKYIIRLIGSKDESSLHTFQTKIAAEAASPTSPIRVRGFADIDVRSPKAKSSTQTSPATKLPAAAIDPAPRLLIILEFAENGNMWDYMQCEQTRRIGDGGSIIGRRLWLKWARQLSSGLACIHAHGIVHHDIKPHNILLTDALDIRISDFGNSCFAMTDGSASPATPAPLIDGLGRGTQAYSAPELLTPPTIYSFPVDVYSAGVTLFTMITGVEPFSLCRSSPIHLLMSIRKGFFESGMQVSRFEYKFLDGLDVGIPLMDIVRSMVDRDDRVRPSAADLLVLFEDAQDECFLDRL